jgi:glycogen(starch) synthase
MPSKTLDILVVSNLWPPHFVGGYELGARDVVERLAARGHRVRVLTSTYGMSGPVRDGNVDRVLYEQVNWRPLRYPDLLRETTKSIRARSRGPRVLRDACFDVVYLFNPLGLNASFVQALGETGRPVVAYVSDNWAASWPWCDRLLGHWMQERLYLGTRRKIAMVLARRVLRRLGVLARLPAPLPIRHAQFVSRYIRDISLRTLSPASEEVIPWGIDVARFPFRERRPEELRRWIFVGQVMEHKGVHTAVDAVGLLRKQGVDVSLTIYGDAATPFGQALRDQVRRDGLDDRITFAGARPRERLWREAYDTGGVLIFPTMWEEPFSITLLEAFASGIPVMSTLTGGTGEIARHGETATVFGVGNDDHLAAQYYVLLRHPERALAMARRARAIVERHLGIEAMVDRAEAHLVEVVEGRGSSAVEPVVAHRHPWEDDDLPLDVPARAVEPDPRDGGWVSLLLRDLAATAGEGSLPAEPDTAPEQLFPVRFPPSRVLSERLMGRLQGLVLNAGAGSAAISIGCRQVRLDLQAKNRPDVCGDLHALPFRDGSFDGAVSIAVLEHCRRPWQVMRELRRVLAPGGHLVLSAPFLEPMHLNPGDYFRFTADGLRELALDAGLAVVETGADFSVQQSLAWVLWEVVRHHPRHRYLSNDGRVQRWFDGFSSRGGYTTVPTLADAFYLVARRDG